MRPRFPILNRSETPQSRSTPVPVFGLAVLALLLMAPDAHAVRIGDLGDIDVAEQMRRFFSMRDPSVRYVLAGTILLGITCGALGCFIVVRRLALLGDTLSHAVLPGVAVGFLWSMSKDPIAIFIGAVIAGLLGTSTVTLILKTTRLKEDTALGMVLAGYFAIGACLITMLQRVPTGAQSGIQQFFFGQAADLGPDDLWVMAVVSALVFVILILFHKELLVTSFDPAFASLVGVPARIAHHTLMALLAFTVVMSLQAVGVVLVSAMLIIPAATAYLLVERMAPMVFLAAFLGAASGILGAFLSYMGNNLPTGPFIVLSAGLGFFLAFLVSPRHGVLLRAWRVMARGKRFDRENTLKAVYRVIENRGEIEHGVSLRELAEERKETLEESSRQARALRRHGLAALGDDQHIYLTRRGWQRAGSIVRNHRLWELYLTNAAELAPDHVHESAEQIEHVLGEDTVRRLERNLGHARRDPHGRRIPSSTEIHQDTFMGPPAPQATKETTKNPDNFPPKP